ncbi:UDP-N-acetylmuramoyl-L-alanyl-D-glutamate--2,6-diaminopimelate ligase [Fructilactobacillus carniphilus]|uniref:UDP-N-acetylmuramoyl-L-alanyl-D-glutamate--2, 6-diaminopimelate ligase n=1 Tax=Fructilactobacillus carniphilus TaxID=2940297 RepID=A0ABY5C1P0_9LACO|nr:UDP-N-acetylmuramoyl-L-alanyl-D-glutamate--2,6-diaminopimelate ligase [Fructilactobacillus carniphilus]USS91210.1 UDP-N-acetylmuramoyl-L-alanyl-D-glutamate--2,6-diaminopimelate ligase [Fructilactobacillus carniphilus]
MLSVAEIIKLLQEHHLLKSTNATDEQITFQDVSYDSRTVTKGALFFCKGNFHPAYLRTAQQQGATGFVAEEHQLESATLIEFVVSNVQKAMALLSAAFFDFPQNELTTFAITGTKGKTTTAYFLREAINKATENRTALFSTVNTILGPKPRDTFKSALTTPESLDLFKNMRTAVDRGMKFLVMEVSSQAYLKNRVFNLHFDVGSFLNISPDHVGENEHPTFANYLHCKEQLLVNSKQVVINAATDQLQDVYFAAKTTTDPENIYLYARNGTETALPVQLDFTFDSEADTLTDNEIYLRALTSKAQALKLDGKYQIGIPGDYNETNAVDAIINAGLAGFQREQLLTGLAETQIPGRMERYVSRGHGTVYVDYAHNYASTKALLQFLKTQSPEGKTIAVVGSPGNKGIDRREGFGKALSEEADVAILTTDDPAFEDPVAIAKTIDSHINHQRVQVHYEMDREKAIQKAIQMGTPSDIIVVLGKGQDPYQKIKGVDTPYPTDSVVVRNFLDQLQ